MSTIWSDTGLYLYALQYAYGAVTSSPPGVTVTWVRRLEQDGHCGFISCSKKLLLAMVLSACVVVVLGAAARLTAHSPAKEGAR